MKRKFSALFLSGVVIFGTGCYSSVLRSGGRPDNRTEDSFTNWHFIFGLTGVNNDAPECHEGLAKVHNYMPWWSFLLSWVTLNLVSTTRTEYVCTQQSGVAHVETSPTGE